MWTASVVGAFPSALSWGLAAGGFGCTSGHAMPSTAGRDPWQPHCTTAASTPCRAFPHPILAAASPQPLQEGIWYQLTGSPNCTRGCTCLKITCSFLADLWVEQEGWWFGEGRALAPLQGLDDFLNVINDFEQHCLLKMPPFYCGTAPPDPALPFPSFRYRRRGCAEGSVSQRKQGLICSLCCRKGGDARHSHKR